MRLTGKIRELDRLIVTDPCFEGNDPGYVIDRIRGKDWNVSILINPCEHAFIRAGGERLTFSGKEYFVLMTAPGEIHNLNDNGSFSYRSALLMEETQVSASNECIAFGVNSKADSITAMPGSGMLPIKTSGEVGRVYEGTDLMLRSVRVISIIGYLDDKSGYSTEDLIDYITSQLEITEKAIVN